MGILGKELPKECEAAMDRHIKSSVAFAKTKHRWDDKTGAATSNIKSKTEHVGAGILSTIYGDIETNLYLEKAWFFYGQYAIIEMARNENIGELWSEIKHIMDGDKFSFKTWESG